MVTKRSVWAMAGLLIGVALDMIPHLVEIFANVRVCRESCPTGLRAASLAIYTIVPMVWGLSLPWFAGKRHALKLVLLLTLPSFLLMLLLTFFLYRHQHL